MTASAVTDLPQPDLPTRRWVSPRSTVSEAPRTAAVRPPKLTSSRSTSSSALNDRIRAEHVAQAVSSRLMPSTSTNNATPGMTITHGLKNM